MNNAKPGKAAIIIVNWNGLKLLQGCFDALSKQTYLNYDVYFVDNGSHDGSIDFMKAHFPTVQIIILEKNTGFAGGNNVGIRAALKNPEVEYIVLLNNDTIVEPAWLEALVAGVNYETKTDMVSSKALFEDGTVQTIGLCEVPGLLTHRHGGGSIGYEEPSDRYDEPQEIFCPSGVSALYTRRLLEEIGLLDRHFFAYTEDYDLGLRARKAGYRCLFKPDSQLVHFHSKSSGGAASPLKAYLTKRNKFYVAIKHLPWSQVLIYPFRDLWWNIVEMRKTDDNKSVQKLKKKIGLGRMALIMLKVYGMVLLQAPNMIIKRYKKQQY